MMKAGKTTGIIVAPLSVCPQWQDLFEGEGFTVVAGHSLTRPALLRAILQVTGKYVIIVPWRKIASQTGDERKHKRQSGILTCLLDKQVQAVILDESHNMASPSADQAKAARKIAWQAEWVRLLTGTPSPNHYGSLWGQLVALDRNAFCTSYEKYAQRYLIRDTMFRNRVLGHLGTVETHLRPTMLPFVSIIRREDVFGPDCFIEQVKYVELPVAIKSIYNTLASKWLIVDPALGGFEVDASQVLKRLIRLQQVASGYVPSDDGVLHDLHTAKLDTLEEDLQNIVMSDERAVVFYRFRWERDQLLKIGKRLQVPIYEISGGTPVADRATCLAAMELPGAKIAMVQTRSGGVGISFAEVPYQLVLSQSFSFTDEEQARQRTYKPKQARFITYYRAKNTVDEFLAEVLETKTDIHEAVTNADLREMAFGRIKRSKLKKVS